MCCAHTTNQSIDVKNIYNKYIFLKDTPGYFKCNILQFSLVYFSFMAGYGYIAQTSLTFRILLPQLQMSWDTRHVPSHPIVCHLNLETLDNMSGVVVYTCGPSAREKEKKGSLEPTNRTV